jgi:hypothetical protein
MSFAKEKLIHKVAERGNGRHTSQILRKIGFGDIYGIK